MLGQLQSEQLSLDQYCSSIITSVAPLLPGYLNKQLTSTESHIDEPRLVGSVSVDIAVSIQLLAAVMELSEIKQRVTDRPEPITEVSFKIEYIHMSGTSDANQILHQTVVLSVYICNLYDTRIQGMMCIAHDTFESLILYRQAEREREYFEISLHFTACFAL